MNPCICCGKKSVNRMYKGFFLCRYCRKNERIKYLIDLSVGKYSNYTIRQYIKTKMYE